MTQPSAPTDSILRAGIWEVIRVFKILGVGERMEFKPVIAPFPAFLALSPVFTSARPENLKQVTGHLKGRAMHYAIHVTPTAHLAPIVVGSMLRFMTTSPYHSRELIVGGLMLAGPFLGYVL